MKPVILCHVIDCTSPATTVCGYCCRRLCVEHYGDGSSYFCQRDYHSIQAEKRERRAEAG